MPAQILRFQKETEDGSLEHFKIYKLQLFAL